ncbi:MAG: hypothetical protein R3D58_14875 [Saprospiraceae bacterium]
MDDQLQHETIEKYLLGQLSRQESDRLEADMAADPALYEQVEIKRLALLGLQRMAGAELGKRFAQWDSELDEGTTTQEAPPASINIWPWTACLLFLLVLVGIFWHVRQMKAMHDVQQREQREIALRDSIIAVLQAGIDQKQNELTALLAKNESEQDSLTQLETKRLRAELFRLDAALQERQGRKQAIHREIAAAAPPPPDLTIRGDFGNDDREIKAAAQAFNVGNYSESEKLLKGIPSGDPRQSMVVQALPYALFYQGKYREAAEAFMILKQNDRFEATKAEWYLLLCYRGEGWLVHARAMRAEILKNQNHPYYFNAEKIGDLLEGN